MPRDNQRNRNSQTGSRKTDGETFSQTDRLTNIPLRMTDKRTDMQADRHRSIQTD